MKFDVKFSRTRKVDVMGPGSVYMDETGLVIEGDFTRFYIPFLTRILRRIVCARGHRTIPFSRIEHYTPPGFVNRAHRLIYCLPDRSKAKVLFVMRHKKRTNNAEFFARFQEYRAAATTLQA
jgi:hypothetical protein